MSKSWLLNVPEQLLVLLAADLPLFLYLYSLGFCCRYLLCTYVMYKVLHLGRLWPCWQISSLPLQDSSGGKVVEHSTTDPEIKGSNLGENSVDKVCHSNGSAFHTNIRLGWTFLPRTNVLAYLTVSLEPEKNRFVRSWPAAPHVLALLDGVNLLSADHREDEEHVGGQSDDLGPTL
jgi:hypothetical protein